MRYLTADEVKAIPFGDMPLLTLSDNLRSTIGARIKTHTHGLYNHMMWLHGLGRFISQDSMLREVPLANYLETYRLKFWTNPEWTAREKGILILELRKRLEEPWYKRMYDPADILGKWLNSWTRLPTRWIQIPGAFRICSEFAEILKMVDDRFDLKRPSPAEVNRWLEAHEPYQVYGRYVFD